MTVESGPPPPIVGKRPRMSRFLRTLVTVTTLIHVPFVFAMSYGLSRAGLASMPRTLIVAAITAWGIGLFVGRARRGMYDSPKTAAEIWLVDVPYYIHWCACLFLAVPGFIGLLLLIFGVDTQPFLFALYAIGLVFAGYGILYRRIAYRVDRIEVPVSGLPENFRGYTIAHLSDLHIGSLTPKERGLGWARRTNAENCDAVVVTGDMVTSGTAFYDDIASVVGALKGKDGVYVSMGNHDYFGDGEPLITRLRATGALVLRNEGRVIERDGQKVYLAGIDDTWTKRDDIERALAEKPEGTPTILLAHDPDRFRQAIILGVELVLSGHTHGGQVSIPGLARWLSLSRLAHHYTLGLYRQGSSTLYVSPGLGTTGPPVRFGVAPAIAILTLVPST